MNRTPATATASTATRAVTLPAPTIRDRLAATARRCAAARTAIGRPAITPGARRLAVLVRRARVRRARQLAAQSLLPALAIAGATAVVAALYLDWRVGTLFGLVLGAVATGVVGVRMHAEHAQQPVLPLHGVLRPASAPDERALG